MSADRTIHRETYTEPRNRAANGAGNHGTSKRRAILAEFCRRELFDSFVDPKIQSSADGIANDVQMKAGVESTQSMALNDLANRRDSTKAWLAAERRIASGTRSGLTAIGDQNRGLHDILGEFKWACQISIAGLFSSDGYAHAIGALARPASIPAAVKVTIVDKLGLLPGWAQWARGEMPKVLYIISEIAVFEPL